MFRLKNVFNFLIIFTILFNASCSSRRAFAPGEIPTPSSPSAQDKSYAQGLAFAALKHFPLSKNTQNIERVQKIFNRLAQSIDAEKKAKWEFIIFDNPNIVNAASGRGNIILIWSGMLNFVKSDDELAIVIAHEMGHILAKHLDKDSIENVVSGARNVAYNIGGSAIDTRVNYGYYNNNSAAASAAGLIVGLTSAAVGLIIDKTLVQPEKHRKEIEADNIGLFIVAQAGYNPEQAKSFWNRMNDLEKGKSFFLASHPTAKNRLTNMENILPDAIKRYKVNPLRYLITNQVAKNNKEKSFIKK